MSVSSSKRPQAFGCLAAAPLRALLIAAGVPALAQAAPQPAPAASAVLAASGTLYRYARAVDDADAAALADTFTPDAVVKTQLTGANPIPDLVGRDAITGFIMKGRAAQKDMRRHLISNLYVDSFDGKVLVLKSYFSIVVTKDGAAATRSSGTYEDQMRQGPDGRWRTFKKSIVLDAAY